MNYVFYDFETSGLSWYFDQPIQLAAKLGDENFNIIDEFNEKCRNALIFFVNLILHGGVEQEAGLP